MSTADLTGLNAGYVAQMLEAYLEAPSSVPVEWRELFERDPVAVAASLPGLEGLLRSGVPAGAAPAAVAPPPAVVAPTAPAAFEPAPEPPAVEPAPAPEPARAPAPAPAEPIDDTLLGGVAAAMALVKAYRMHGHLAAQLDPLGSEPMGDPALDESRLVPALTPELQARIPASLLRLYVEGDTLLEALPRLRGCLHRLDRLRDRAHLRSCRARLAPAGDRIGTLPPAARRRGAARAAAPSLGGRRVRAVPAPLVPRPEAVLARGPRVARADARRGDLARRLGRCARGRDRHGPSRPPQRARPHGRPVVPVDPAGVRRRALDRRARRRSRGRHGRRQVPPAGLGHAPHPVR